jgi:hypothetical protein
MTTPLLHPQSALTMAALLSVSTPPKRLRYIDLDCVDHAAPDKAKFFLYQ